MVVKELKFDRGEHQILDAVGLGVGVAYAVVSATPFQLKEKGVRMVTLGPVPIPIPNPFNTDWMSAEANFTGVQGAYGRSGIDHPMPTFFVDIKIEAPAKVWLVTEWTGSIPVTIQL